jgi:hypothetical protein
MPKGKPFVPGQSGNPEGQSKYAVTLRKAIEAQETPERVCDVIDAMRTQALAGEKSSPAAAKVYLGAVGVKLDGSATTKVDLSDAPDEVMAYLRGKIPAN